MVVVGTAWSQSRSAVPASTCCSAASGEAWPWMTWIPSTYALRSGSVSAFHAGLRPRSISLVATYFVIWYGPLEIVC